MANRKITPLKDEELDPGELILEKLSDLEAVLSNIKGNGNEVASMLKAFENLPRRIVIAVNNLLEERKRRMDEEAKAEDGMTVKELIETTNSIVTTFNENHAAAVTDIGTIAKYLTFIKKAILELPDKIKGIDSRATELSDTRQSSEANDKLIFPTFPDNISQWCKYLFYDVPDYFISRIERSRFIPRYVTVCSFFVTLIVCSLLIFIGQENAYLSNENTRLRQTEEKYIILRNVSRGHTEWSRQADYIDLLYSDPDQNRAEIDRLKEANKIRR